MYYISILPFEYPAKTELKFCRNFDKNTGKIVTTNPQQIYTLFNRSYTFSLLLSGTIYHFNVLGIKVSVRALRIEPFPLLILLTTLQHA
jgi:hypothetical protein